MNKSFSKPYDNMSDYDNDGVANYLDKYPFNSAMSSDNETDNDNESEGFTVKGSILINDLENCEDNETIKLIFENTETGDKYFAFFDNCSDLENFTINKFYIKDKIMPVSNLPDGDYKVYFYYSIYNIVTLISDSLNNGELMSKINLLEDNLTESPLQSGKIDIINGWNLKSLPLKPETGSENITVFNADGIKTVWQWTGSNWKVWSPESSIITLLNQYKIEIANELKAGEGFWVNASKSISISTSKGTEYGVEKAVVNNGWNLVGIGKNIKASETESFSSIKSLWQWTGSNWKVWSPQNAIITLLNQYKIEIADEIKAGEGFWVNK
jgi:hypothetical protein